MKSNINKLNYPHISDQPEYKAAAEKLDRFMAQHQEAQSKLERLQAEYAARAERLQDSSSAIYEAEALLAGNLPDMMTEQIRQAGREVEVLAKAVEAQRVAVSVANRELSRIAGQRFADEHKARVKRMAQAVKELHEAARAEEQLRDDLVSLGYLGTTVPAMPYLGAYDPNDHASATAYYWMRDANDYTQTAGAKETATLRQRLVTALP